MSTQKGYFKSFCVDLAAKEINRIYCLDTKGTLNDNQAIEILRDYIKNNCQDSEAELGCFIDMYEKCSELKKHETFTFYELESLVECGLQYKIEKELKALVRTADMSKINECLLRIQNDCIKEVESSHYYKEYKNKLLLELRK